MINIRNFLLFSFTPFLLGLATISCSLTGGNLESFEETIPPIEDDTTTYAINHEVHLAGNAFVTHKVSGSSEVINGSGLANWTNGGTITSVYLRTDQAGKLYVKLRAKVAPSGNSSEVSVKIGDESKVVTLTGQAFTDHVVGSFDVDAGYVKIDLQGVSKTGGYFGDVSHVLVGGPSAEGKVVYSDDPSYYYWARRGPSCHMNYTIPTSDHVMYYYGEVTVPTGEDKEGTYFMSNGFGEGYFGMQVNSPTERRVLFSVWSPYQTDNPAEIPESMRVKLNRKGTDVYTGEFGNEGSGGQSYLRYNWAANTTYKFLLKGQPDGAGATDYTAWIFTPEENKWMLISSWKRPQTNKYLTNYHSFLESFNPNLGYHGRKALYSNRWVRTATGTWLPINKGRFTVDNTYHANQRVDAIGGIQDNVFFLQMGGFFNTYVAPSSTFNIVAGTIAPDIDFDNLP